MLTYSDIDNLFEAQIPQWQLAFDNYDALHNIEVRNIIVNGIEVRIQHNPARITSVSSKPHATVQQSCFLCHDNLPQQQLQLPYNERFTILVNPYPIFDRHFTIPATIHTPQRIAENFDTMLQLARSCTPYTLFYNGPRCGASAPMHLHFQAGNKGFMTFDTDLEKAEKTLVKEIEDVKADVEKAIEEAKTTEELNKIAEEVEAIKEETPAKEVKPATEEVVEEVKKEVVDERALIRDSSEELTPILNFKEERKMEKKYTRASEEYRSAWAKTLMGLELDEEEKRALGDAIGTTATTFTASTAQVQGINNVGLFIPTSIIIELSLTICSFIKCFFPVATINISAFLVFSSKFLVLE